MSTGLFTKIEKYYRRYGLTGGVLVFAKKMSMRLIRPIIKYDEVVLVKRPLEHAGKKYAIIPEVSLEIVILKEGDYEELRTVSGNRDDDFIRSRMKNGESCYVARHNGRICFYSWVSTGERVVNCDRKEIPIGKGEIYIRDCFTLPEFRGKGIAPYFYDYISGIFGDRGFKRAVAYVMGENYPSIRSFEKAGFSIYERVSFIKPFFRSEAIFRTEKV